MVWVVETPQRVNVLSVGHLLVAFFLFLNQNIMTTQIAKADEIRTARPPFILHTDVVLKNGVRTELVTLIPHELFDHGNGLEAIQVGVSIGLQHSGIVQSAHDTIYRAKNGVLKHWGDIKYHTRVYDPAEPSGFRDIPPIYNKEK